MNRQSRLHPFCWLWLAGITALLLWTCAKQTKPPIPQVQRDTKGYEIDLPGRWYRGDLHVHATGASNDTGGDSTPEAIAKIAQQRGLHFVVLTDHSNSTGSDTTTTDEDPKLFNQGPEFPFWDKASQLSIPGKFLMIDGNEISPVAAGDVPKEARGHIGCIPKDLKTFDRSGAFQDRPRGQITGKQVLVQAKQRGCFAIVNHPYSLAIWIAYDWSSFDYDGMEIWNGGLGYDSMDKLGTKAWRCDLLKGRQVTPVAASDNHRVNVPPPGKGLNPALGWPSTSIFADKLTWPSLIKGLQQGNVMLHEGKSTLQLHPYNREKRHTPHNATIRFLRLRGTLDPESGPATLTLTRTTACNDPRPKLEGVELTEDTLLEKDIQPGTSFDLEVAIQGETGVYHAVLLPLGRHYAALSRAIRIQVPTP